MSKYITSDATMQDADFVYIKVAPHRVDIEPRYGSDGNAYPPAVATILFPYADDAQITEFLNVNGHDLKALQAGLKYAVVMDNKLRGIELVALPEAASALWRLRAAARAW